MGSHLKDCFYTTEILEKVLRKVTMNFLPVLKGIVFHHT